MSCISVAATEMTPDILVNDDGYIGAVSLSVPLLPAAATNNMPLSEADWIAAWRSWSPAGPPQLALITRTSTPAFFSFTA